MAVLFVFLFTGVGEAASKTIKLRAVTAWPKTVFEVQNFMKFLDIVRQNVANQYPGELEIQYTGGPFVLYLNKPITSADLSGLKIRCSPTHMNYSTF